MNCFVVFAVSPRPTVLESQRWWYQEWQISAAHNESAEGAGSKRSSSHWLVSVCTAAGWHTNIVPAYFHFYFFTAWLVVWKYVCTFSALHPHVCLCAFVDVQRCYIIPLSPLLSAEPIRKGVKPSRCYAEWFARQWVASEYWGRLTVPPPILSPQDCLVSRHPTTGLQGIRKGPTPKSASLGTLCVHLSVEV